MTADRYLALGWNPIPLRRDKRPWIAWAPYQKRKVTPEELQAWRRRYPGANVGIVTGAISGIIVLDVDGPAGAEELKKRHLPPTPTAATGKGTHYYFLHPGGVVRTMIRRLPELDLKGDGGYVMAPPSTHPSGRRYAWVDGLSPWDVELAPPPAWLLEHTRGAAQERPPRLSPDEWARIVGEGASPGGRHPTMTQLAGRWLGKGLDPREVLEMLLCWNEARCSPPKPEAEVVAIVRDLWRRDQLKGGRQYVRG